MVIRLSDMDKHEQKRKSGLIRLNDLNQMESEKRREQFAPSRQDVFNSAGETTPSGRANLVTMNKNIQNRITPEPTKTLKEDTQLLRIQQPDLVKNYSSVSTPAQKRTQWVEERLEQDRKGASANPILSKINTALEPISRGVYNVTSRLAPLQQGAGNALGIKAETAPYEPTIGNKAMEIGGMLAGSLTNPSNISQGVASLGVRGLMTRPTNFNQNAVSIGSLADKNKLSRAVDTLGIGAYNLANKVPVNNKIAKNAIEGATAGAMQGGLISGVRGETDLDQLATNVGLGAVLGGAGDAALGAIGQGVRSLRNRMPAETPQAVQPALPQSIQRPETAAIKEAPKLNEPWFEKLFGSQGVGIMAGRGQNKRLVDTQITRFAKEQSPIIERMKDATSIANQDYVDKFAPFMRINDETYLTAMDSTRANNLANVAIKDKLVNLEGEVIGNSLKDVYSLVPRGQKNLADTYIIMRDAVDRMRRGLRVYDPNNRDAPKTWQEAQQRVFEMEQKNPWLTEFGNAWNDFNTGRQELWVESGLVSRDLINAFRSSNPNYAPMMRQMPTRAKTQANQKYDSSDGLSKNKLKFHRAVGSSRKIIEPAQSMINSTASSYHAMLRNRAMQKLYDAVLNDPEKYQDIIEIVPMNESMRKKTIDEINQIINEDGIDALASKLNDEFEMVFNKGKQSKAGVSDNHVTVMINGEPVKMNVKEKQLLRAIEGVSPERLDGILKVADFLSRGVKMSATGALAPLQGLKLFARDIPVAFAQSKDKVRFLGDISHALISQVADWLPEFIPGAQNLGRLAREYYRAGGGYEQYLRGDSRIRATAADITRDPLLSGRHIWKVTKNFNPFRPLKELGDAFENIPRIAAFNAAMRRNGWSRDEATVRQALSEAREATVNWSRKGARGQQIESILPYSNAAVQGTYRMAKLMKEQPVSALLFLTSLSGATIAAYEKFKDDPDYQHRSRYAQGIPVHKTSDGKFVTIPIEPAYQYIADQVLNFYKWAKDQEELPPVRESIQEGFDALTPKYIAGPVSMFTGENRLDPARGVATTLGGSSLEPLVATSTGKNYYGGDIVPREYQDRSTEYQQNETTSAAANWAAENLGMDAFTFDYLAQKFGGDLAKIMLPMTSKVGRGDPTGNIVAESLARLKLLEDPVMSNNLSEEYYKLADKVTQAKANEGAGVELPPWYKEINDKVTGQKKGSIAKAISELNSQKKSIQRDPSLTAKERAEQLRAVQTEINLLRIKGIEMMEKAGVK